MGTGVTVRHRSSPFVTAARRSPVVADLGSLEIAAERLWDGEWRELQN
jgi:hypothetical protein